MTTNDDPQQRFKIIHFIGNTLNRNYFDAALDIRFQVFVKEQGCSEDGERDEYDAACTHFLVFDEENDISVATARAVPYPDPLNPTYFKIGRVAVIQTHRKFGLGRLLMQYIEEYCFTIPSVEKVLIHAQCPVVKFYERCDKVGGVGWLVTDAEVFYEEGIPHVKMEKNRASFCIA